MTELRVKVDALPRGPGVLSMSSSFCVWWYSNSGERTALGSPTKATALAPASEISQPVISMRRLYLFTNTAFPPTWSMCESRTAQSVAPLKKTAPPR